MKKPSLPPNEADRIKALYNSNILDTPIQESFERITRLAKVLFQVPIVAFSLIDAERQWFKSIQGLDVCQTSREVSFCAHAILQDEIFIVSDALADERFADNPLVTADPNIRFYAGYPVRSRDKQKLGTLCLIDVKPRSFTQEQLAQLKDLAGLIEDEVAANKIQYDRLQLIEELSHVKKTALVDGLTRLLNRVGIEDMLKCKMSYARENHKNFGIALIDIDNFKLINDTHGHCAGDEVIRQVARRLLTGYRETDSLGRWGGEEFLVVLDLKSEKDIFDIAERARKMTSEAPVMFNGQHLNVTVTTGVARFDWNSPIDVITLVSQADQALYRGKHRGKNLVVQSEGFYFLDKMHLHT